MGWIHHYSLARGGCIAGCSCAAAGDVAAVGRGKQRGPGAGYADERRHAEACPDAGALWMGWRSCQVVGECAGCCWLVGDRLVRSALESRWRLVCSTECVG